MHFLRGGASLALLSSLFLASNAPAASPCEKQVCPSSWVGLDGAERQRVFAFAEDYKKFMGAARTEYTTVAEAKRIAVAAGFREWKQGTRARPGERYFHDNRGRGMTLFVIGSQPVATGVRVIASHIDSPRIELKGRPVYEKEGLALFQTSIHGSILNYQWTNTPLALVGQVARKDGTSVDISVGLNPGDPVFMIAGLSPHVDVDLRERKQREVIEAEELDPIIGSVAKSASEGVVAQVVDHLRASYGIGLDDLTSADLQLVPAMPPRDVGFDRALMTMYGQDDRFSAYASLRAILDVRAPRQTAMVFFADNEEESNVNATGARSDYFSDLVGELLFAEMGDSMRDPHLRRALRASKVISSDVNDAINPTWPSAWEHANAARLGHGINLKLYGEGSNATPEYTAWVRRQLDEAGIPWQTAMYKVGKASGGTVGVEFSRRNMDVVDIGAPVMSIHNVYDLSSKVDLWWLYKAHAALLGAP